MRRIGGSPASVGDILAGAAVSGIDLRVTLVLQWIAALLSTLESRASRWAAA
jgi:hypothetical protein